MRRRSRAFGHAILTAGSVACLALPAKADLGATLFFSGERTSGTAIRACASCHGLNAKGQRDGSRDAPAIDARSRLDETDRRPAYRAGDLATAVTTGRDPSGRELSMAMPRVALSPDEIAALEAFLDVVAEGPRIGVSPTRLHFMTLAPWGIGADSQRHVRAIEIFKKSLEIVGAGWGRRIDVTLVDASGDPARLGEAIDADPPLAFVLSSGLVPGGALDQQLARRGISNLLPVSPVPASASRARVRGMEASPADALRAIASRVRESGANGARVLGPFAPPDLALLRSEGLTIGDAPGWPLIAVGDQEPCAAAGSATAYWVGGSGSTPATCPIDATDTAFAPGGPQAEASGLRDDRGIPRSPLERRANVAARILGAALKEAGRAVDRRTLVEAFDRLEPIETGLWPRLDYRQTALTGTREVRFVSMGPVADGR